MNIEVGDEVLLLISSSPTSYKRMELKKDCTLRECKEQYPLVDSITLCCERCWCEVSYSDAKRLDEGGTIVCGSCWESVHEKLIKNQ